MSINKDWKELADRERDKLICRGKIDDVEYGDVYDILTDLLRGDIDKQEAITMIENLYDKNRNI